MVKKKTKQLEKPNYIQQGYESVQSMKETPPELTQEQKREWLAGVADACRQLID
jgi:hypothetical protein